MCGGSSFHPRRFLAGVPRSTSSGSINLWIHRLRHTVSAVFGRGCDGRRSVCATPLYRYLCMPQLLHVCSFCMPRRLPSGWRFLRKLLGTQKIPGSEEPGIVGAPEGIRTPNLLIRSQMLYPLSYRRMFLASDFFNPSRQQVILYGGYEGPASRKTQKGPIFGSPECCNASFYREIPGFLVPGKFFKIFLCCSEQEVGSLRGDSPSRAILTLRPSNFSLITLGVFLLKV